MVYDRRKQDIIIHNLAFMLLFVCLIAVIELIIIIILSTIIKAGSNERFGLTLENSKLYADMGFRISAHIDNMIKRANNIRYKLPTELYSQSVKKNAIVQETCNRFYEELSNKLK
jgi:hypothetical protein